MAAGGAELMRETYTLFNAGDFEGSTARLHPEIELRQWEAIPDAAGVYEGRDGFVSAISSWLGGFEPGFQFTPVSVTDVGDRVLMEILLKGRGRGSGVEIEQTLFHVWELRDGLGYRCEVFRSRDEARAAAEGAA